MKLINPSMRNSSDSDKKLVKKVDVTQVDFRNVILRISQSTDCLSRVTRLSTNRRGGTCY